MAVGAVLDACVLYPFYVRDVLLRLAQRRLFVPYWSSDILEETGRNLRLKGVDPARFIDGMRVYWPASEVPVRADLVSQLTNDPKDRHVLAAAIEAGAENIVTTNLKDFPTDSCAPWGVEACSPDAFLTGLHDAEPQIVYHAMVQIAGRYTNPPINYYEFMTALEDRGLSEFASRLRVQAPPQHRPKRLTG